MAEWDRNNGNERQPGGSGDVLGPIPSIRMTRTPGPAEAGLLFSLLAFLQLYAGQIPFPALFSDSARIILSEVLFIGLPPLLAVMLFRFGFSDTFRFRLPRWRELGVIGLMAPISTMAAYSAGILAIVLIRAIFGSVRVAGDLGDVLSNGMPLAILTIGVVPALCEELLFRGFIQRGLEGFGAKRAVLLSGILFGLFHFDFQRFAAQTLLGLVIAYVVYRSGSILNGMLIHFLHNAGSVVLTQVAGGLGLAGRRGSVMESLHNATSELAGFIGTHPVLAGFFGSSPDLEGLGRLFLTFAGSAGGDLFENVEFQTLLRDSGIPLERMILLMGIGSAVVLVSALFVLGGLLLLFRHVTRDVPRPPPQRHDPAIRFITAVPGLILILTVYVSIGLGLAGIPLGEAILRLFRIG